MLLVIRSPAITFLPFYAAEDRGFFEEQGISIRCLHSHDDKRRMTRLLEDGDVAYYTSIGAGVEAALRGWGEVRALCATSLSRHPCAARSEIKSLEGLKGKKVMVGGGRSKSELLWLCHRYGWQPAKDIEIASGDLEDRAKAFSDPSFSAVFGRPQYLFWLKKKGFHLLPYPDPWRAWAEAGLITSLRLIRESPQLVQKAVNAVVMATAFVKKHREEAIAIAMKHVPYLEPEAIEGNYELLKEWYSHDVSESAIAHQAEVLGVTLGQRRAIALKDVADLSFLEQALGHNKAG